LNIKISSSKKNVSNLSKPVFYERILVLITNLLNFFLGLVQQLRSILGLPLDEAIKHNPLQNDDLAVPRFLVDCINIIDQGIFFD
jgi:hypothetical protein